MAGVIENKRQRVNGGTVTRYLIDDGRVVGFGYENSPIVVSGRQNTLDMLVVGERDGLSDPLATRTIPVYRPRYRVTPFMRALTNLRIRKAERQVRDAVEWATGFPTSNEVATESLTLMGFTGVMASRHDVSGEKMNIRILGIYQAKTGEQRIASDTTLIWNQQEDPSVIQRKIRKAENKALRAGVWAEVVGRIGLKRGKKLEAVFAA